MTIERDTMEYDVVVVGAGPAGLATAIHIKQLAAQKGIDLGVCVLEKGSEVGAHIVSGAVMDPRALAELFPDWQERGAPLRTKVSQDQFLFLNETSARAVPHALLPACFKNTGNYIVSLGEVVRWLGQQAENLGVEVFAGFAAAHVVYGQEGAVLGVQTGDVGVNKQGTHTAAYQPGMRLLAKYTVFAEGARGHLGKEIVARFNLQEGRDPQVYGLGFKELWEVDPAVHQEGLVVHTAGWPLDTDSYGGSFLYHLGQNQVSVGFVVGLGYQNPYLSPYEEFQRYKTHPSIARFLRGGKRIAYGARAIAAGGLMSLPKLVFPGGALVGCDAGFLNASRIKGSHAAIKSGMLCAHSVVEALAQQRSQDELHNYPQAFHDSWLFDELYRARNFKQWMGKGLWLGSLMVGIEQTVFKGNVPWTLHHKTPDHAALRPAAECKPIAYPKPDGVLSFDRLSSVYLSNTNHNEDQPAHLTLKDPQMPTQVNWLQYAGPEARYCPAGVYEYVPQSTPVDDAQPTMVLHINAQNCIHCKTCDIKDPAQNIVWVAPEGGGGPNYPAM